MMVQYIKKRTKEKKMVPLMTICVRPAICVVSGSFFQIYRKIFKRLKCGRQFSSSSYWKSSKWGRTVGIVSLHTLELRWQTVYY